MWHPRCSIISSVGKVTRSPAARPRGQGSVLWTGRHCSTSQRPTLGSHNPSIQRKPGFYRRELNWPLDHRLVPCFWMHGAIPLGYNTSSMRGVEVRTRTLPLLLQTWSHTCEALVCHCLSAHNESTLTLLYIWFCWHLRNSVEPSHLSPFYTKTCPPGCANEHAYLCSARAQFLPYCRPTRELGECNMASCHLKLHAPKTQIWRPTNSFSPCICHRDSIERNENYALIVALLLRRICRGGKEQSRYPYNP